MKPFIHRRLQLFFIEGRGGTISYFHQARHAERIQGSPAQGGISYNLFLSKPKKLQWIRLGRDEKGHIQFQGSALQLAKTIALDRSYKFKCGGGIR
jgi:hypothetical protein